MKNRNGYTAKASITNLRTLNAGLEAKGVSIPLHESAKKNGSYYSGNTPYRAWGKTIGTARQVMDAMLDTYRILKLEVPEGV